MSEWQDIAGADTYFITRAGATSWAGLTTAVKQAYLTTAYNRLYYHKDFFIPSSPSGAALLRLQIAQCEFAWYLKSTDPEAEDRRKALQAQGVTQAGVVSESYKEDMLKEIAIPQFVLALMNDFNARVGARMIDIRRDEDYSVNSSQPVADADLLP